MRFTKLFCWSCGLGKVSLLQDAGSVLPCIRTSALRDLSRYCLSISEVELSGWLAFRHIFTGSWEDAKRNTE